MLTFGVKEASISRDDLPRCLRLKGGVIAEVGVARGNNAVVLLASGPSLLYLIDPWKCEPEAWKKGRARRHRSRFQDVKRRFAGGIKSGIVKIYRGFSTEELPKIPAGSCDYIYVDAIHLYKPCLGDLEASLPALKETGILAGHDFENKPGVTKAVLEFLRRYQDFELVFVTHDKVRTKLDSRSYVMCRKLIVPELVACVKAAGVTFRPLSVDVPA